MAPSLICFIFGIHKNEYATFVNVGNCLFTIKEAASASTAFLEWQIWKTQVAND
jgi:hypothetical protein